jgi:hypothetical protein
LGLYVCANSLDLDALAWGTKEKEPSQPIEGKIPKKKNKVVKKRSTLVNMTLGDDIRVEKVIEHMGKALIGRFQRRICNNKILNNSMQKEWPLILGYGPIFHILLGDGLGLS